MNSFSTLILIICLCFIAKRLPPVEAACCRATIACQGSNVLFNYCSDCFVKDAFDCCGSGKCNVFCCDCDNGCRGSCGAQCGNAGSCSCSSSSARQIRQSNDEIERERQEIITYLRSLDTSNDWRIDFPEFTDFVIERYEEYVARNNASSIVVTQVLDAIKTRAEFDKLDVNGSGYLEFSEIDSSLSN